jgi:hypothetical protein
LVLQGDCAQNQSGLFIESEGVDNGRHHE